MEYVINSQEVFDNLFSSSNISLKDWLLTKGPGYTVAKLVIGVTLTLSADYYVNIDTGYTFDGSGYTIYITSNVANYGYRGPFKLSGGTVQNVNITGNSAMVKQIDSESGWICRSSSSIGTAAYGCIDNCSSTLPINIGCGGICGSNAGGGQGNLCIISNCTVLTNVDNTDSGGICGRYAGKDGTCLITNCDVCGNITGTDAGGICGKEAGSSTSLANIATSARCVISGCSFVGSIGGGGGGTCGGSAGATYGWCDISDCSVNGNINSINAGGICGQKAGYKGKCTITNCDVSGNITNNNAGGICGSNAGTSDTSGNRATSAMCTVIGCSFVGSIGGSGNSNTGGICGGSAGATYGWCDISDCSVNGNIVAHGAGGICGTMAGYKGKCTITNCDVSGNITWINAGGICGTNAGASDSISIPALCTITGCSFVGNIGTSGSAGSGGICGQRAGYMGKCTITNCDVSGNITGTDTGGICGKEAGSSPSLANIATSARCVISGCSFVGSIGGSGSGGTCGGSAGATYGWCDISDCSVNGNINSTSAGGICGQKAGYMGKCTITNCDVSGNITGTDVGGICGSSAGTSDSTYITISAPLCIITGCNFSGNIVAEKLSGGICGTYAGSSYGYCDISNCLVAGNIVTGTSHGGITASYAGINNGKISITNCIVTCNNYTIDFGGIIAPIYTDDNNGSCIITRCYYAGYNYGDLFGAIIGNYHSNTVNSQYVINIRDCYSRYGYNMIGYKFSLTNNIGSNLKSYTFDLITNNLTSDNYKFTTYDNSLLVEEQNLRIPAENFSMSISYRNTVISTDKFSNISDYVGFPIFINTIHETAKNYTVHLINNNHITLLSTISNMPSYTTPFNILNTGMWYVRLTDTATGLYVDSAILHLFDMHIIDNRLLIADIGYCDNVLYSVAWYRGEIDTGINTLCYLPPATDNYTCVIKHNITDAIFELTADIVVTESSENIVVHSQSDFDHLFSQTGLVLNCNIELNTSVTLHVNEHDRYIKLLDGRFFDGSFNTITIRPETSLTKTNITDNKYTFTGLFFCFGGTIKNTFVEAITELSTNGSTYYLNQTTEYFHTPETKSNSGWFTRSYPYNQAKGKIVSCKLSNSCITAHGGGICGSNAGALTIQNCFVENCILADDSAGMVGTNAGYKCTSITPFCITECTLTLSIAGMSNGVCGSYAGFEGYCYVDECDISFNQISADSSNNIYGGVCGMYAGYYGQCIINRCKVSSVGKMIQPYAGGICGRYAGMYGSCLIDLCSFTGVLAGEYSGGICGAGSDQISHSGYIKIADCLFIGTINAKYVGGIAGGNIGSNCNNANVSTVLRCYSSGKLTNIASYSGGICGAYCAKNGKFTVDKCYSTVDILFNTNGYYGGIVGSYACNGGILTIADCCFAGTSTYQDEGGIAGSYLGAYSVTSQILLQNCYTSVGNIVNTECGNNSPSTTIITIKDCYAPINKKIRSIGTIANQNGIMTYYFNTTSGSVNTNYTYTTTTTIVDNNNPLPNGWTESWTKPLLFPILKAFSTGNWDSSYTSNNGLAKLLVTRPVTVDGGIYFKNTISNLTLGNIVIGSTVKWYFTNGCLIDLSNNLFVNNIPSPINAGVYYYDVVQEKDGIDSIKTRVEIVVLEPVNPNIYLCNNLNFSITQILPVSVPTITYKWERSNDNLNWVNVVFPQTATLQTPYFYRVNIYKNLSFIISSPVINPIIREIIFTHTMIPKRIILASAIVNLTFGVIVNPAEGGNITNQWENSDDGIIWNIMPNKTATNLIVENNIGTKHYRLKSSYTCEETSTPIVLKTIDTIASQTQFDEFLADIANGFIITCNVSLSVNVNCDISNNSTIYIPVVTGTIFNGNGHTIRYVNTGPYLSEYNGLFRLQGGRLDNIFITQDPSANIIIKSGMVCDNSYGILEKCGTYGLVTPQSGICGNNCGQTLDRSIDLYECYSNNILTNSNGITIVANGLIGNGAIFCSITKCYSNTSLLGDSIDYDFTGSNPRPIINITDTYVINDKNESLFAGTNGGIVGNLNITRCYTTGKFIKKHSDAIIIIKDSYIIDSGQIMYPLICESDFTVKFNDILASTIVDGDVNYEQVIPFVKILESMPLGLPQVWLDNGWMINGNFKYPLLSCFFNRAFYILSATTATSRLELLDNAVVSASITSSYSNDKYNYITYSYAGTQINNTTETVAVQTISFNSTGQYNVTITDTKTGYTNNIIIDVIQSAKPTVKYFKSQTTSPYTSSINLSWSCENVTHMNISYIHNNNNIICQISSDLLSSGTLQLSNLNQNTLYTFMLRVYNADISRDHITSVRTAIEKPLLLYSNFILKSSSVIPDSSYISTIITGIELNPGYFYNIYGDNKRRFIDLTSNVIGNINDTIKYTKYSITIAYNSDGLLYESDRVGFRVAVINNATPSMIALAICKKIQNKSNSAFGAKPVTIMFIPAEYLQISTNIYNKKVTMVKPIDSVALSLSTTVDTIVYLPLENITTVPNYVKINSSDAVVIRSYNTVTNETTLSSLTINNIRYIFEPSKLQSYIVSHTKNGSIKYLKLSTGSIVIDELDPTQSLPLAWNADGITSIDVRHTGILYKTNSGIEPKLLFVKITNNDTTEQYYILLDKNNGNPLTYTDLTLDSRLSYFYGNLHIFGCIGVTQYLVNTYIIDTPTTVQNQNLYINYSGNNIDYKFIPSTGINLSGLTLTQPLKFTTCSFSMFNWTTTGGISSATNGQQYFSVNTGAVTGINIVISYVNSGNTVTRSITLRNTVIVPVVYIAPVITLTGNSLLIDTCLDINNIPIDYTDIHKYVIPLSSVISAKTTVPRSLLYIEDQNDENFASSLIGIDLENSFENISSVENATDVEKNISSVVINETMLLEFARTLHTCLIGSFNCANYEMLQYLPKSGQDINVTGFGTVVVRILQHLFMKFILANEQNDTIVNNALNNTIVNESSFISNLFIDNEIEIKSFIEGKTYNTDDLTKTNNDYVNYLTTIGNIDANSNQYADIIDRLLASLLKNSITSGTSNDILTSTKLKGGIAYFLYQDMPSKFHNKTDINYRFPVKFDTGDKIYFTIDLKSALIITETESFFSSQKLPSGSTLDDLIRSSPRIYFEVTVGE